MAMVMVEEEVVEWAEEKKVYRENISANYILQGCH
jgi:hypothetical protein